MPFKTQVKRCEMKKLMIPAALAASLAVPAVAIVHVRVEIGEIDDAGMSI